MPRIKFLTNNHKEIEVEENANLLRSSMRYEGGIPFRCGGGICGTCKCKIEEGSENLDKIKKKEYERLGEDLIQQGYRLACQTFVLGDVSVSWDAEAAARREARLKEAREKRKRRAI